MDVERYDLHSDLQLFNGVAGDLTMEEFQNLSPKDMPKLSTKIAGPNLVAPRMADSLLEVGKTIYVGIPATDIDWVKFTIWFHGLGFD